MFKMTSRTESSAKKLVHRRRLQKYRLQADCSFLRLQHPLQDYMFLSSTRSCCVFLYNLLFLNCYSLGVASIVDTCFTALHNGQLPVPSSGKKTGYTGLFSVSLPSINTGNKSPNCILFGL